MAKATVTRRVIKVKKKEAPKSAPRTSKTAKLLDERHIGEEIVDWSKVENIPQAVYQNLRHYNYFYDSKTAIKWAEAWIKKNRSKADQEAFANVEEWRVNTTFGGLCKMALAGAPLPENNVKWMNTRADEIIAAGKAKTTEAQAPVEKKAVSDLTREKIQDFIGNVEEVIDMYHDKTAFVDTENYSVYNELKRIEAPKSIAQAVLDYYTPIHGEIEELVTKKTPDLVEAYRNHMPKTADQKKYMAFLKQILDDCKSYMNAKTATKVRKPRVKKAVPVEKIIANVKYQKDSAEFKLTSVAPANIVGAQEVYLFNTKYRTLTRIVAASVDGLSVRGTTIIGCQEEIQKKTLRKPDEVLPQLQSTKARAAKVFVDLKTKAATGNARINEETIILKVFK